MTMVATSWRESRRRLVAVDDGGADYWILESPLYRFSLRRRTQERNDWIRDRIYGLEWGIGDIPYSWLFERLMQATRNARTIYVHVTNYGHGSLMNKEYTCAYNNAMKRKEEQLRWVVYDELWTLAMSQQTIQRARSTMNGDKHNILYEGWGKKITSAEGAHSLTVYTVTQTDITFAFTMKRELIVSGSPVCRTEHPKLLIFETHRHAIKNSKQKLKTENLDLFTYVNGKFVNLEKHIRNELQILYYGVLEQICNLERQVLKNTLTLFT